jgi:hypothetical protein
MVTAQKSKLLSGTAEILYSIQGYGRKSQGYAQYSTVDSEERSANWKHS